MHNITINGKMIFLASATVLVIATIVATGRWRAVPENSIAASDSHAAEEASPSAHQHENDAADGEEEISDLDRPVDELWKATCEHDMPAHVCSECRYEIGVVKLSPELMGDGNEAGLVSTVTAALKDFSRILSLTGDISMNESKTVRISSPEAGIARSFIADIGQKVVPGDRVIEIDSKEVAEAKAEYLKKFEMMKFARKNAEREASLFAKKISAEIEVQEARAKQAEAEIEWANAKGHLQTHGLTQSDIDRLSRGTVHTIDGIFSLRSPIAGVVLNRSINAGEQVEPGKELLLISDLAEVWVWANLKEEELVQLEPGEKVVAEIEVPGLGGKRYSGTMDMVSGNINAQTRNARARVVVPNNDGLLKPGMFANIRLLLPGTQPSIIIPQVAVLSDEGRQFVFVHKEDDYWIRRPVTTGVSFNNQVSIVSGLSVGQKIIADGSFLLKSDVLREKMGAGCAE
jgi:cobalt-zinc-cadmium efflux system membrane fusion protein